MNINENYISLKIQTKERAMALVGLAPDESKMSIFCALKWILDDAEWNNIWPATVTASATDVAALFGLVQDRIKVLDAVSRINQGWDNRGTLDELLVYKYLEYDLWSALEATPAGREARFIVGKGAWQ